MDGWTHNKIIILYLFDFHVRNIMGIVSFFQYMKTGAEELWRYLLFVLHEVKKISHQNKHFSNMLMQKKEYFGH